MFNVRSHVCGEGGEGDTQDRREDKRSAGIPTGLTRKKEKKNLPSLICVRATGAEPGRAEVPTEQTPGFTARVIEHAWVEINC